MEKPHVQSRASRAVSRVDCRKSELLQVVSFRRAKVGEELFVNYGEKVMVLRVNSKHFLKKLE